MKATSKQGVSVIIPTYNEQANIRRLLKSIKLQSFRKIEIIVVDDGSRDKTVQIAKKFTKKVYMRQHAERSVQRNFGAKVSSYNNLIFLDADMALSKNVIKECVKALDDAVGAVIIPEVSKARSFWEKVKAFERSFYNTSGDEITDAARFFTKKSFVKAGGYDENITGPEDWDLPDTVKKLGFDITRIKSPIYHYERIPSLSMLVRKKFYYGMGANRYMSKQKISKLSPKTIYFLRPVFYRNWKKLISKPALSAAMAFMLTAELVGGGLGYFLGRIKK